MMSIANKRHAMMNEDLGNTVGATRKLPLGSNRGTEFDIC
jgi:hypothetical protein